RDRRQRLAAKAESHDGIEVIGTAKLRRGVTFKCHNGVVASHTLAVVDHSNQPLTAGFDLDIDPARACIKGVLEQLLDHRSRSLDNLACRDLVCERVRHYPDFRHPANASRSNDELSIIAPARAYSR